MINTKKFQIRNKTVKDLIDALKVLDPDLPLNDFETKQTFMNDSHGIYSIYNFEFSIENYKKIEK